MLPQQILNVSTNNAARLDDLESVLDSIIVVDTSDEEFVDQLKDVIAAHRLVMRKRHLDVEIEMLTEARSRL